MPKFTLYVITRSDAAAAAGGRGCRAGARAQPRNADATRSPTRNRM